MLGERSIYSFLRLVFYGAVIAVFWFGQKSKDPTVSAFFCGAIVADYITWIIISLFELPNFVREFSVDAVVNTATTLIFLKVLGIEVPHDPDGMSVAFLAFVGIATAKVFFYLIGYFSDALEE